MCQLQAQKYMTQSGTIKFFSEAPLENIESVNNQVSSIINMENGEVVFTLLMKAFNFEKALMQEHFNEKYVESEKFPKATFKGKIKDFNSVDLGSGKQTVEVVGQLTIHGVTNDVQAQATIDRNSENQISASSTFNIDVADYDIKIPAAVKDNIAKSIEITVNMEYDQI